MSVLLIVGLVLWVGIHLIPSMAPSLRSSMIGKMGAAYKGLFALSILGATVLIVLGWKDSVPYVVYNPPAWTRHITMLLMLLAIILLVASILPTNLRRYIRHPQLTAVKTWALAHLLSNGDSRSLALFGALLAWAVLSVIFINKRDSGWKKPESVPLIKTAFATVVGVVAYVGLVFLHPYLSGMSLMPR